MSLELRFGGWFQCRLATDPDPYDDPAGVSGKTLALTDEPPLDGIIRFHEPVAPRSDGPQVGVFVDEVLLQGSSQRDHSLIGARVELLGEPRFEGRNGLVEDDAYEPIVPFALRVVGEAGLILERTEPPDAEAWAREPNPALVRSRRGDQGDWSPAVLAEVGQAIGIEDVKTWRAGRAAALAEELAVARACGAVDTIAALETRSAWFHRLADQESDLILGRVGYRFELAGLAGAVEDPQHALDAAIDVRSPWRIAFWMGGWDYDALCGFVRGTLALPLVRTDVNDPA